jgi:hypothetical protein
VRRRVSRLFLGLIADMPFPVRLLSEYSPAGMFAPWYAPLVWA